VSQQTGAITAKHCAKIGSLCRSAIKLKRRTEGDRMAHCTNCKYKWKIKEILLLRFSKNGKDCLNCGQRQFISAKTQRFFTLGYLSLIFVPFLFFRIKLSDKDEPMF